MFFLELIRVLKPDGSLFIRMTSNTGIKDKVIYLTHGIYNLTDRTERFWLTKSLLYIK
jgi:predicted methyltransferase